MSEEPTRTFRGQIVSFDGQTMVVEEEDGTIHRYEGVEIKPQLDPNDETYTRPFVRTLSDDDFDPDTYV